MREFQPRKTFLSLAALALLLASAGPTYATFIYKVDDGTPESAVGRTGGDLIWLNRFTADPANPERAAMGHRSRQTA
jgi:hypothetical protein